MLPLTCGRAAVRDRSQHDVACPDKEATGTHGNTNEFYLDGLDREELLSQYAPALTAQKMLDLAVQTLAHEKMDPQNPPEHAIGPVLQLVRSAFAGLLHSMIRLGPRS